MGTMEREFTDEDSTLRRIAEDAFLLAARIREGESLDESSYYTDGMDEQERESLRQWRIIELVVNLGERIVQTAGIEPSTVWTPTAVRDLLDAEYSQTTNVRYIADFSPEAWVQDNAIHVDPEGPTEWETRFEGLTPVQRERILSHEDGLDNDDLLKKDPAAPEWVREWRGPFSIHVREEHK